VTAQGALRSASLASACVIALSLMSACGSMDPERKMEQAAAREAAAAVDQNGAPLRLARAARAVRDYSGAINLYKSAIAASPTDTDTQVELGETELEAGQIDDAVTQFEAIPPTSKSALGAQLGLERAYLMLSQPQKALGYADAAAILEPANIRVLIGRGVALDMLGRHAEAQTSYRGALAITPSDIAARSNLALSLAMTGQFDEAIAILTPLARAPNATPRLRQNLALVYGLKGDSSAARTLSLVDLDPKSADDNLKFFAMVRKTKGK
jgi:Flp pilus assembly protein TadD